MKQSYSNDAFPNLTPIERTTQVVVEQHGLGRMIIGLKVQKEVRLYVDVDIDADVEVDGDGDVCIYV